MAGIPDGNYDPTSPGSQPLSYARPFPSHEEMLVTRALESVVATNAEVSMIPCPLPQVVLFPPRFGYGNQVAPGIRDVIDVDRMTKTPTSFSGTVSNINSSDRNTLGTES